MRPRAWLLFAVVVVVAAAAVVVSLRACRDRSLGGTAAASFSFDDVPIESPGLALAVTNVRGQLHEGYMDWACLVRCNDPAGCSAELRVTIHYTSSGSDEIITFSGPIDVPVGAHARLGGIQRPPRTVNRIDRIVVDAKPGHAPGAPPPTPRI